jgi:hypothetical protein
MEQFLRLTHKDHKTIDVVVRMQPGGEDLRILDRVYHTLQYPLLSAQVSKDYTTLCIEKEYEFKVENPKFLSFLF